jgi:hypothetical protein
LAGCPLRQEGEVPVRVLPNFLVQDARKVRPVLPVRLEVRGFRVWVFDHLLQGPTNAFDIGLMTRPPHQGSHHHQDQDRTYRCGTHRNPAPRQEDLIELDEALRRLEELDARCARVVELRFFGGLTEREAAEVLGISVATLKRD